MLNTIENTINSLIEWIGSKISWISFFLVLIICIDVFLRYAFSSTKTWILDLEWQLFSILFLLGAAYGLKHDQHVRVDLFYQKFSDKTKAWVNLLGTIFFLLPWCLIIIVKAWNYALNSWYVKEGSPDGGLPAWYIVKFCIVLGFMLLLLQGLAVVIGSLNKIRE